MDTRKCPFCGEEIKEEALKCKHCGEWLVEAASGADESTAITPEGSSEESGWMMNHLLPAAVVGVIGWLLIHFGSWNCILGKKITAGEQVLDRIVRRGDISWSDFTDVLTDKKSDFIWNENSILLRMNDGYYGFIKDAHFFDSPFIQWVMLVVGVYAIVYSVRIIIWGID